MSKDSQEKVTFTCGLIMFLIVLLFIGPWLSITSLNILFGLEIPMNLKTWFAAFWINAIVFGK